MEVYTESVHGPPGTELVSKLGSSGDQPTVAGVVSKHSRGNLSIGGPG